MKNKILLLFVTTISLGLTGCVHPEIQALDIFNKQEQTVFDDLANTSIQSSLDHSATKVENAVKAGDVAASQKALVDHNELLEKVIYLTVQHERAKSVFMLARTYIESQRFYL